MNQGAHESSDQGTHGRTRQTAANYFLGATIGCRAIRTVVRPTNPAAYVATDEGKGRPADQRPLTPMASRRRAKRCALGR